MVLRIDFIKTRAKELPDGLNWLQILTWLSGQGFCTSSNYYVTGDGDAADLRNML